MTSPTVTVVVYAVDKARLARFYAGVLELAVIQDEQGFTILAGDGVELSIVAIPEHVAQGIQIAGPPVVREDAPVKASFLVSALASAAARAVELGGTVKPIGTAWSWRGDRHLDACDPEGNVVQFRQRENETSNPRSDWREPRPTEPSSAVNTSTLRPE